MVQTRSQGKDASRSRMSLGLPIETRSGLSSSHFSLVQEFFQKFTKIVLVDLISVEVDGLRVTFIVILVYFRFRMYEMSGFYASLSPWPTREHGNYDKIALTSRI